LEVESISNFEETENKLVNMPYYIQELV